MLLYTVVLNRLYLDPFRTWAVFFFVFVWQRLYCQNESNCCNISKGNSLVFLRWNEAMMICLAVLNNACLKMSEICKRFFLIIQWANTVCYRKCIFVTKFKLRIVSVWQFNLILVHCKLFFIVILLLSRLKTRRCNILFRFWNKDAFLILWQSFNLYFFKICSFLFFPNGNIIDNLLHWSDVGLMGILHIALLPLLPFVKLYICSYLTVNLKCTFQNFPVIIITGNGPFCFSYWKCSKIVNVLKFDVAS